MKRNKRAILQRNKTPIWNTEYIAIHTSLALPLKRTHLNILLNLIGRSAGRKWDKHQMWCNNRAAQILDLQCLLLYVLLFFYMLNCSLSDSTSTYKLVITFELLQLYCNSLCLQYTNVIVFKHFIGDLWVVNLLRCLSLARRMNANVRV